MVFQWSLAYNEAVVVRMGKTFIQVYYVYSLTMNWDKDCTLSQQIWIQITPMLIVYQFMGLVSWENAIWSSLLIEAHVYEAGSDMHVMQVLTRNTQLS